MYARGRRAVTCLNWKHFKYLPGGTTQACHTTRKPNTTSHAVYVGHWQEAVGGGLVASLARPGGNVTGFTAFEYSMSGKWLELLKDVAPTVKGVAVLRDPGIPQGIEQFWCRPAARAIARG